MRKFSLLVAVGLMVAAFSSAALAEDGRIYYKKGLRFEADDFELKFNTQLQPRYEYVDDDSSGRVDAGRKLRASACAA